MKSTSNDIAALNEKFSGINKEKMSSVSLMGFPLDVDSGRGIMFGSEVKQIQCIKDPDIPRVSTGHENMFGYVSHPYKEMKGD